MTGHVRWRDIRAQQVAAAGGEHAIEAATAELLAKIIGQQPIPVADKCYEQHLSRRNRAAPMDYPPGDRHDDKTDEA
jgi:hypothetical protein